LKAVQSAGELMSKALLHIVAVVAVLVNVSASAQENAQRENVRALATIKGVRPGLLAVVNDEGDQWLVKVDARPQDIKFVASAKQEWLRPGMIVRFKNTFDRKGKPLASVQQLEVISIRSDTKLGLIPESKFGGPAKALFSNQEPEPKKQTPAKTAVFTVAGKLQAIKDGKIVVVAGQRAVRSELAENAKISVDLANYSLAGEGDSVEITGWYYEGQENRVYARQLTISSKRQLGDEDESKKKLKKKRVPKPKKEKSEVEKRLENLFSK